MSVHTDGSIHRTWLNVRKTVSRGIYLISPKSPVLESDGTSWSSDYPVVAFFWPRSFFQVFMLLKETGTDYYCNVTLPPVIGNDVVFVDLDLDVVVTGGQAEVVDRREFDERKVAYQSEWIENAQTAATTLMSLAENRWGPFHPATALRWRALYHYQFN
ncbi:DUF402 domain-containing protein [Alicyclobacillus dauci]|uniref:DUF402 domain-containing protein n=1 Tax=Alicyclobacillus dauci TaxID=1475485 RepID=A0ABY6ZAN8_9BACL|nr:DUF402 domain-containing protein [Alicyclobacillus dauci]WAH39299.1 DUF402 domain-containing protein [Alicyclobacillus dauci]